MSEINIYNKIFEISEWSLDDDSFSFKLEFLKKNDCVIYSKTYNDDLDREVLQTIRYSEIEDELITNNRLINLTISDLSNFEYDEYIDDLMTEYVKSNHSEFENLSSRKKRIGDDTLDILLGPASFQFNIDLEKRYLEVVAYSWDEDNNREEKILIDTVSLGWNEENQEDELYISNVVKVLFYF